MTVIIKNGVSYYNEWLLKNVWHKQKCDQNGCDYKGGLPYYSWILLNVPL